MADKYFIFGATYNGDGTSSAEASSAGGVGAWSQDTIMTGTAPSYGSLSAGDTVYIRSKTGAGANANITKTMLAAITLGAGASVATLAAPITWILDNGSIWSGISGTLTYSTNGDYHVTLRPYNRFIARTKHSWVLQNTKTTPSGLHTFYGAETDGLFVDYALRTNVGVAGYGGIQFDGGYHKNLKVYSKQLGNGAYNLFIQPNSQTYSPVVVLDGFEVWSDTAPSWALRLFGISGTTGWWKLSGGGIFGAAATSGCTLALIPASNGNAGGLHAVGFQIPKTMLFCPLATARVNVGEVAAYGLDGGAGGEIWALWGNADCRNYSSNYPYLNATLATSTSAPVSWRLVPEYASWVKPAILDISKLYTSASAQKTVTLELLVSDSWGAGVIDKSTVWMSVSYIDDDTGAMVMESTKALTKGSTLDASSAAWSATSWGMISFTDTFESRGKRKMSLATAGKIRKDTAVTVRFCCAATCLNTTYDIFIIDPDVQLS